MPEENATDLVELATEITIAWLGNANNRASPEDVPAFLRTIHATVSELSAGQSSASTSEEISEPATGPAPAVSVRKSLASKDHIISMIDGKPYKTLRRHLAKHGLTAEQYRERFNLKPDYPMVSANYSATRSEMAKKIGLGSKGRRARGKAAAQAKPAAPAGGRGGRGRKPTPAAS